MAVGLLGFLGQSLAWAQTGAVAPAAAASAATITTPPSVEAFYAHADIVDVKLSPSGTRLAVSMRRGERVALGVIELGANRSAKVLAQHSSSDVRHFQWVNDQQLVYTLIDLNSGSGDQRMAPGLFAVDVMGGSPRMLILPYSSFITDRMSVGRPPLDWRHTLLFVPNTGGDEVIIGRMSGDGSGRVTNVVPMRLNVVTREITSLAIGAPSDVTQWLFDSRGMPRLAAGVGQGQFSVHWRTLDPAPVAGEAANRSAAATRTAESGHWQPLARMTSIGGPWSPHSVDDAGNLYVTAPEGRAGTSVLKKFDWAAGRPSAEAVVRTPGFDFRGYLVRDHAGRVLGVRAETDAETTVWSDPALARWQAQADERLPGRINRLDCQRCDGADPQLLVRSWSDRHPGELWLFAPQRGAAAWEFVANMRQAIDPRQSATLDFHRFKARDGLEIPVWVTLPAEATPIRRPAVVLVHGGPWVRGGHWRWDADAQFLASRGYVVIEPEFRGSTGYGSRHFRAGLKQWGRSMQDDVADALQWAVGKGWVDSQRVCIAGASYGGYAALMGPIRDPQLYRCAAAWVAVSDPLLLFGLRGWSDMSDEAREYSMPRLIGDPVADLALLTEVSPLAQADKLKVPVLLAYGVADRRVPLQHGERMRDALRAAGREPVWITYPEEGHGWLKAENRFDFARRLEAFLAQHLK